MITLHSSLRVIISVLMLSIESVSDLSPGGKNPYLIISTSTLLATVDSTGIPFHHQSKKINKLMVLRLLETPQSSQNTE